MTLKNSRKKSHNSKGVYKKNLMTVISNYFSDQDIELFKSGEHYHLYRKLGAHYVRFKNQSGFYFALWAPNAHCVSVIGNFNYWDKSTNVLNLRGDSSGIWEGFIPNISENMMYKYHVISQNNSSEVQKADPFSFCCELAKKKTSLTKNINYQWNDKKWIKDREKFDFTSQAISIYELHLGSWRRNSTGDFKSYCQLADELVVYVKEMGFTHVEFLPLMEHPFYGSWGYQALGFFSPTPRYGSPQDLMYLIDSLHQNGIGVVFDWVSSHFPCDEYGLANFDGSKLFEYEGIHPDWNTCIFNLGRHEIISFLISSAVYWIEKYHIDALRIDAVASMLYLDYSRKKGQWKANILGGRENLEAVSFIRQLNQTIKTLYPDVHVTAEDSSAWPNVSRPCASGGLGFDMKWNMGWMHDTLEYFGKDYDLRKKCYKDITFSLHYAFSENFLLSLSHDEVVHEKSSLIGKMPGDDTEKFANLRCLFGYMYAHPGKKMLFMGGELAQWNEWSHESQIDWHLLKYARHKKIQKLVKDLNILYRSEPALYQQDFCSQGFQWIDGKHSNPCILSFLRKGFHIKDQIFIVCNFGDKKVLKCQFHFSSSGVWREIFNSTAQKYGGRQKRPCEDLSFIHDPLMSSDEKNCVKNYSVTFDVPALSVTFFKRL